jgi:chromate transporter
MASHNPSRLRVVLPLVLQASTFHMGGTATQSWLRARLVDAGTITDDDFNRCFAIARLTPGTNLLAFYAALGHMVGRWRGVAACLAVSTIVPSTIAAVLGMLYIRYTHTPYVDRFMAGAQAGAVAVLFWTAVQLAHATISRRLLRGLVLAGVVSLIVASGRLPPIVVLLGAAAAGAFVRSED